MIKILDRLDYSDNKMVGAIDDNVRKMLVDMGITLFPSCANPDFMFILNKDVTDELLSTCTIPIVVFEKIDGSGLKCRNYLDNPIIHKIAKPYWLRDCDMYNETYRDNRYFTKFLTKDTPPVYPISVSPEGYAKIGAGITFGMYEHMNTCEDIVKARGIENERHLDVFFAGTTEYGVKGHWSAELITEHRESLVRELIDISCTSDIYVDVHRNRKYNYCEYIAKMLDTKVIVSPWGFGEACHRDYEAIMCGCTVIKPRTDFLKSAYNVIDERYMTWCKPDWSDLSIRISDAIRNFDDNKQKSYGRSSYCMWMHSTEAKANLIRSLVDANFKIQQG